MSRPKKSGDPRLKNVPSVDQLLRTEAAVELRTQHGLNKVTALARSVTSTLRTAIRDNFADLASSSAESLLAEATKKLEELASFETRQGITSVVNATGVILHTNLGRAPLSESAKLAMTTQAAGYCSLEYDSASGMRGKRGARVESLLRDLTGAEDALVVNNCAAAALLILGVIGRDGETLVSRGELVEIGGDFRVPDVMASSGTRMVEVGTTNKTHLDDYRKAISSKTRLIMRVHPSNYRVVGFTSSPSTAELASLAHEAMLPFYEDAGSGQLIDLSNLGIKDEPIVSDLISAGADLVSFSGDKLLGSVQAGLIVGKRGLVDRLRRHPLYRALRSDKVRLAALEATLIEVQLGRAKENIPILKMLSFTREELQSRTEAFVQRISNAKLQIEVQQSESAIGGGAGPTSDLPTVLIAIAHSSRSAQELENALRSSLPPIIGRVSDDRVLLDLRTVFPHQEPILLTALESL